ncbi:MAG TPA: amino acid ABC transporter substrate-binding protein [Roseiarcus sp.]|nr:amino acid ABC transporter substrate-binding protein [Roseiarcus sp.]
MIPIVLGFAAALAFGAGAEGQTLKTVQDRGSLICGVNPSLEGFASKDPNGQWSGFDVDFCRAVAAAIFNDPSKVQYVPLSASDRFDALKNKQIDVLSRNSTWTMGREGDNGVVFTGVTYYDGQAFLVPKSRNFQSALELDGSKVCVQAGTTTEPNFVDFFETNHMKYETVHEASADDMIAAYQAGQCNVLTTDASGLFAMRQRLAKPGDSMILPDIISKEPLGPVVRQDDMQWFNIVKWVNFAMINAEELGVSSKTIDDALKSQKPSVKRLVGTEGDFGKPFGLTQDWAVRVIRGVGNYAEVFDRNVGAHSKLGIPRGLNELWSNGGIQYAPPIR